MTLTSKDDNGLAYLAKRHEYLYFDMKRKAEKLSLYRFARAVQAGRDCPPTGRSCVGYPCTCWELIKSLWWTTERHEELKAADPPFKNYIEWFESKVKA